MSKIMVLGGGSLSLFLGCGSSSPGAVRVKAAQVREPEVVVEIDSTKDAKAVIARFGEPGGETTITAPRSEKTIFLPANLSLLATHVGRRDGTITLIDRDTGGGGLYGVGDVVPGMGTLIDVAPTAARFQNAKGEQKTLALELGAPAAPRARSTAAQTGPRGVSRAELQRAAGDPSLAGARARVGKDGSIKITSVKRGSLAERLGFQRGDVVVSVAGVTLDSPDAALEAMRRVKHAPSASVVVTRDGAPLTLDFQLTD